MKLYYSPAPARSRPHRAARGRPRLRAGARQHQDPQAAGRHRLLRHQPQGYVPLLELDNGERLTEGPAIVQYIADQVPPKKLAPTAGTMARYRLQEWLNFITSEAAQELSPLFSRPCPGRGAVPHAAGRSLHEVGRRPAGRQELPDGRGLQRRRRLPVRRRRLGKHVGVDISGPGEPGRLHGTRGRAPAVQEALKAEGLLKYPPMGRRRAGPSLPAFALALGSAAAHADAPAPGRYAALGYCVAVGEAPPIAGRRASTCSARAGSTCASPISTGGCAGQQPGRRGADARHDADRRLLRQLRWDGIDAAFPRPGQAHRLRRADRDALKPAVRRNPARCGVVCRGLTRGAVRHRFRRLRASALLPTRDATTTVRRRPRRRRLRPRPAACRRTRRRRRRGGVRPHRHPQRPAGRTDQIMLAGAELAFAESRAQGGVHGRRVRIVSLDDELKPERAVANYEAARRRGRIRFLRLRRLGHHRSAAAPLLQKAGALGGRLCGGRLGARQAQGHRFLRSRHLGPRGAVAGAAPHHRRRDEDRRRDARQPRRQRKRPRWSKRRCPRRSCRPPPRSSLKGDGSNVKEAADALAKSAPQAVIMYLGSALPGRADEGRLGAGLQPDVLRHVHRRRRGHGEGGRREGTGPGDLAGDALSVERVRPTTREYRRGRGRQGAGGLLQLRGLP